MYIVTTAVCCPPPPPRKNSVGHDTTRASKLRELAMLKKSDFYYDLNLKHSFSLCCFLIPLDYAHSAVGINFIVIGAHNYFQNLLMRLAY